MIEGTLSADADGCLVVDGKVIIWPKGYMAQVSARNTVEVLNENGEIVARTEHAISVGGGQSMVGATGSCIAGRKHNEVFQVNDKLAPLIS